MSKPRPAKKSVPSVGRKPSLARWRSLSTKVPENFKKDPEFDAITSFQYFDQTKRALYHGSAGQGWHVCVRAHGVQAQPCRAYGRAGHFRYRQALSDLLGL